MEDASKTDKHLSSAVAFVEGGIQDACDDACSICLEDFCDSDPSTVTTCKHEYHLQCILEWSQRSSQCPMCWQPISLKDPTSQELLEAVERERTLRQRQPRSATIFHHPTLGDFELQHLPIDANEAELEERIMQHLAAAAAMGRAHIARREGHRGRSRGHGRPQYLVFSANQNGSPVGSVSASSGQSGENEHASAAGVGSPSVPVIHGGEESSPLVTRTNAAQPVQISQLSSERNSSSQFTPVNQEAGPSDFQSLSESLKSRFNAVSTRYKDSIIKSTRGWKERLFSRNQSVADIGSEVRREVNAGIATVSRMMERLDTRDDNSSGAASSAAQNPDGDSVTMPRATESPSVENPPAPSAAASGST